jgi:hypothetical protein
VALVGMIVWRWLQFRKMYIMKKWRYDKYYTFCNFYIYLCFQNIIQGTKKLHILNFMNKHIPIMTSISTKNLICTRQWQLLLEKTWQPEIIPNDILMSIWKRTLKSNQFNWKWRGIWRNFKRKETFSSSARKRQHRKRNRMYEDDSIEKLSKKIRDVAFAIQSLSKN